MESTSTVSRKSKICVCASIISCFLLTIYLGNSYTKVPFLDIGSIRVSLIPSTIVTKNELQPSPSPLTIEHSLNKTKEIPVKIETSVNKTKESPVNIEQSANKPNVGSSNIEQSANKPKAGSSNVEQSVNKPTESPVNIETSVDKTKESSVNIEQSANKTKAGSSNIEQSGSQTKASPVNIEKPVNQTKESLVSIEKPVNQTKESSVNMEKPVNQAKESPVNIEKLVNQTKESPVNIEPLVNETKASFFHIEQSVNNTKASSPSIEQSVNRKKRDCNLFEGKWVYRPMENPLYEEKQCPWLSGQVSCQRFGRPDSDYRNWSWEPNDCDIPRFDGKEMLERLRGKRVIIVGDSLNRNQFESLACLLYSVIPPSRAHVNVEGGDYKIFKAQDYNCTVEFYWSPFLVHLDFNNNKTLRLGELEPRANTWKGADVMVFNSGHWWIHHGILKPWNAVHYKAKMMEDMEETKALRISMKTWSQWIDQNIDPKKTTVFFRSISPEHKEDFFCYNVTKMLKNGTFVPSFPKLVIEVVEKRIKQMKTSVKYLNITKLSEYRIDGHPSEFNIKNQKLKDNHSDIKPDCSHWCLPGIPDTWNRLLYVLLFDKASTRKNATSLDVTV